MKNLMSSSPVHVLVAVVVVVNVAVSVVVVFSPIG